MKILFLAKYITTGGVTTHMLELGKQLTKKNHKVSILSGGPVNSNVTSMNTDKAREIDQDFKKSNINTFETFFSNKQNNSLIEAFNYTLALPHSLYMIKKISPDIIHVHWPSTSYVPKIYNLITGIPYLTTWHLSNTPDTILHQKGDGIIAISSDLKKEIINNLGYKKDKVYLVRNGVNEKRFQRNESKKSEMKKKLNIKSNKLVVTFVGSLIKRKGLDVLLKSCYKIKNKVPDFNLILLGEGDDDWINNLIKKYNLSDIVKIFSYQDPYEFYQKC